MNLEKQFRLPVAGELTGYSVAALRKKIRNREIGYRKTGRIITIPASEIARLIGEFIPAVKLDERAS